LLGAGIGALLGGASALLGARQLAKTEILGQPLGGYRLTVGPVKELNLPWVLLGRARLHHRLIAERNHSRREALIVDATNVEHAADTIDPARRRSLAQAFATLRSDGGLDPERGRTLVADIAALLETE
jgi:hypothetical protein